MNMTKVKLNIRKDFPAVAYYEVLYDTIVINLPEMHKRTASIDKSHKLYKKRMTDRFNELVSHEAVHAVLDKYVSDEASMAFDRLTMQLWKKGISIATNRKW